jgi:cytidine deaminase
LEKKLIEAATKAKEKAYAPYSNFKVGAALLASGKIFTGSNIENASYSLTICAERVAAANAIIDGSKNFEKIAVACDELGFPYPCGACLQFLSEFAEDMEVILVNGKGETRVTTLKKLFPSPFSLA